MSFTVTPTTGIPFSPAPATLEEEVMQNLAMILSTPKGTAPLFRDFGLSMDFVDKPSVVAEHTQTHHRLNGSGRHMKHFFQKPQFNTILGMVISAKVPRQSWRPLS